MKRIGNLYQQICDIENIRLADQKARRGKSYQPGIRVFDKDRDSNQERIRLSLVDKTYCTSPYENFTIVENKVREISKLPYPDRIVHHAIMNVLEPVFMVMFTADTYSCIKGRGIHGALEAVKTALQDTAGTQYCLKLDIRKFYPSVDHDILKALLRRKFKDTDLLWLLDGIIDSAPGIPIGNYLSQYFANFYLSGFDHWLKETVKVRYYFRYADDIVILSPDKPALHELRVIITAYLAEKLKLQVKDNYHVFPVSSRGIDFIGYVARHSHIRMRKSIKKSMARAIAGGADRSVTDSYLGWAKHGNCRHLIKTLNNEKLQRTRVKNQRKEIYRQKN
jgi:RNA-directed DNA polymerase